MATLKEALVSIVLVHGGFVDASGWQGVYNELTKDGYHVSVVQNPTICEQSGLGFKIGRCGLRGRR